MTQIYQRKYEKDSEDILNFKYLDDELMWVELKSNSFELGYAGVVYVNISKYTCVYFCVQIWIRIHFDLAMVQS